jgi:predicted short-subunit dehydrogenase-like oxidoreductase (DUF2520 family)
MSSTKRTAMTAKPAPRAAQPRHKEHPPKHVTTVSIIGAGRLGTALARALSLCGYRIEAVVARSRASARRAARLSGAGPLALNSAQLGQLPPSRLLFITTPDDCIAETSARLAAILRQQQRRHGCTILHASGALSSDALADLRDAGFATGSLHPLISISDPLQGAESLRAAFYCIEGDRRAVNLARSLVRRLGAQSFSVNTKDKALYHAAAVMASGHMTALFQIATEMLQLCGLSEKRARAVLLPLVRSTIENLATRTPARALTGTFARADVETMRRHLAALRSQAHGEALAVYALLGNRSLQLAAKNDVNKAALKEMARLLKEID